MAYLKLSAFALLFAAALLIPGCRPESGSPSPNPALPTDSGSGRGNPFDNFLHTETTPADGFDFPFGDPDGKGSYTDKSTGNTHNGWRIASRFAEKYSMGIQTGEDWNGSGVGGADLDQVVRTVANGRVVFAENCGRLLGAVVIIEHVFYENHERRKIRSLYAHLQTIKVRSGEDVKRRQLIATAGQDPEGKFNARLHLEMRWDETLAPTYWPSSNGKDEMDARTLR